MMDLPMELKRDPTWVVTRGDQTGSNLDMQMGWKRDLPMVDRKATKWVIPMEEKTEIQREKMKEKL
jgi:hypothetical protein